MSILEQLEATPISDWLVESAYAYPSMLAGHGAGMAIVIGILFLLNLRLLGLFAALDVAATHSLLKLAWIGFVLNFLTGCVLFVQKATTFIDTWLFLVKLGAVFAATILTVFIQKAIANTAEAWDAGESIAISTKTMAVLSLLLWSLVIITGRIVGYMLQ